jgi:signal peptidase I
MNGRLLESGSLQRGGSRWQNVRLEVSLIDRQLLIALDGQVVASHPYDAQSPSPGSDRPFSIGVEGLDITIDQIRIYRDVYYDAPLIRREAQGAAANSLQLGSEEYLVLGDNSPISEDSRGWLHGPGVSADLLEGKPWLVHLPMRGASLAGRRFQVPDLRKIRYIR